MSVQQENLNFSKFKVTDPAEAMSMALRPSSLQDVVLIPIGPWILHEESVIEALAKWRFENREHFFARFPYSSEGMRRYLETLSIGRSDRILFLIQAEDGQPIGHLGLVTKGASLAEVDAIMLAPGATSKGLMFGCLRELIRWSCEVLKIQEFKLEVLSTNDRALRLYRRLGFREVSRSRLRVTINGDMEVMVDAPKEESDFPGERLIMELKMV